MLPQMSEHRNPHPASVAFHDADGSFVIEGAGPIEGLQLVPLALRQRLPDGEAAIDIAPTKMVPDPV